MADIEIYKQNESTATVQCNHIIFSELERFLSAKAPNYRFHPKFKAGYWDGNLKFINSSNEIGIGLVEKIYEFAKLGKYSIECKFDLDTEISLDEFHKFVKSLKVTNAEGEIIEPRDYQIQAAYEACLHRRLNIQASTSSGKSLIIYIICRFMHLLGKRVILITPQTQLVEQMFGDFLEYGWESNKYCHRIYSGQKKIFEAPVIISCWQSLQSYLSENKKSTHNIFEDFDCVIIDECHTAKGKVLQNIAKACVNAEYRIGTSGTYPEKNSADWFAIVGALGPIKTYATYQMLQSKGYISQISIYSMILEYDKEFKLDVYSSCRKDYKKENAAILSNPKRSEFILNMVKNLNENTIVLFTNKTNHGYLLKELFEKELKDKTILYIDGDVDVKLRDKYRMIMEQNNNVVLLATYGTLSTGVNIKNIHHIIFASGYKSRIKVLQSVGRGLRLRKGKLRMKLYDLVDNISFIDKKNDIRFINYALNHSKERNRIYQEQGWQVKEIKFKI